MNRRAFLKRVGLGFSATALAAVLGFGATNVVQAAAPRASATFHRGAPEAFGAGRMWSKGIGMPSLNTIASALNMSVADLRAELQAGKSVADIAAAKGVALEKVINALVDEYKQQLDAAVAAGRLTQAQAETLLANFRAVLPGQLQVRAVQGLSPKAPGATAPMPKKDNGVLINTLAATLGITPSDLLAELRAGKSVADIAAAKGVALDKVISALTEAYKQVLNARVAMGRMTQAEADAALERFKANLPHLLALKGGPGLGFGPDFASKRGKGDAKRGKWFEAPPVQPSTTPTQTTGLRF